LGQDDGLYLVQRGAAARIVVSEEIICSVLDADATADAAGGCELVLAEEGEWGEAGLFNVQSARSTQAQDRYGRVEVM